MRSDRELFPDLGLKRNRSGSLSRGGDIKRPILAARSIWFTIILLLLCNFISYSSHGGRIPRARKQQFNFTRRTCRETEIIITPWSDISCSCIANLLKWMHPHIEKFHFALYSIKQFNAKSDIFTIQFTSEYPIRYKFDWRIPQHIFKMRIS